MQNYLAMTQALTELARMYEAGWISIEDYSIAKAVTNAVFNEVTSTENTMQTKQLKDVKQGEYFKRKPDAKTVFKRGSYDRESKKYAANDCDDMNREIFLSGKTVVFVGFEY